MNHFTRLLYSTAAVPEARAESLKRSLTDKRKLYKCKDDYITLDKVPTWPEYYKNLSNNDNINIEKSKYELSSKISIFQGDITCFEIDAIVNAANNRMLGGGGVDGAIHRAAGNSLYEECKTMNGCKTGEAKITAGYKLPAKYVIHTVGPENKDQNELKNAYLNSLKLAVKNECRTIAFPCISTGIYGYPNEKAASEVTALVKEFLEKNADKFDRIIFCLFLQKDIDLYEKYLAEVFPLADNQPLADIYDL